MMVRTVIISANRREEQRPFPDPRSATRGGTTHVSTMPAG
jgi:hypothetical protein